MTQKNKRLGTIKESKKHQFKINKRLSVFIILALALTSAVGLVEAYVTPLWSNTYTGSIVGSATNNIASFINTYGAQIIKNGNTNVITRAWFDDSTGSKLSVKLRNSDANSTLTVFDGNANNVQLSELKLTSDNNNGQWLTWVQTSSGPTVSKIGVAHIGLGQSLYNVGTLDTFTSADSNIDANIVSDTSQVDKSYDVEADYSNGIYITFRSGYDSHRYIEEIGGNLSFTISMRFDIDPANVGGKWASFIQNTRGYILYTDSTQDLNIMAFNNAGRITYNSNCNSNEILCGQRLTAGAEVVSDPIGIMDNNGWGDQYILYKDSSTTPARIRFKRLNFYNGYGYMVYQPGINTITLGDCGSGQYALNCTSASGNAYTLQTDAGYNNGAIVHWRDGDSAMGSQIGHLQYYNTSLTRQWDANPSGSTEGDHAYSYPVNEMYPYYYNNKTSLVLVWSGSPMSCTYSSGWGCIGVVDNKQPRIYTQTLSDITNGGVFGNNYSYLNMEVSSTAWQLTNDGVSPAVNSPASNSGTLPVSPNTAYWTDSFSKTYDYGEFYAVYNNGLYIIYPIYNRSGNPFNDARTNIDNYLGTASTYSGSSTKMYSDDAVNQSGADQRNLQVVKNGTTDTMFFFEDAATSDPSISGHKIYGEKYNAAGTAQWSHKYLGINSYGDEEETNLKAIPSVVNGTKDGDAIFVYSATSAGNNVGKLVIQKVDGSGNSVSAGNPNGYVIRSDLISGSYTGIHDINIIDDNAGGAYITWVANINNTNNRVYATHMTWDSGAGDWGDNTSWANNHTQAGEMTSNSDDYTPRFIKYGSNLFLVYTTLEEGTSSYKKVIIQKLDPTTGLALDPDVKKIIEDQAGDVTLNDIFFSKGPDQGGGTYDSANYALFIGYTDAGTITGHIDKYDTSLNTFQYNSTPWTQLTMNGPQYLSLADDGSGGVTYAFNTSSCIPRGGCGQTGLTMSHTSMSGVTDWSNLDLSDTVWYDAGIYQYPGCNNGTDSNPKLLYDNHGGTFVTWQKYAHCDTYIWNGYGYSHSVGDFDLLYANHVINGQKLWSRENISDASNSTYATNAQLYSDDGNGFISSWERRLTTNPSDSADVYAQHIVEPVDNSAWTMTTNHTSIINDGLNTTTDGHFALITVTVPSNISSIVLTQLNNSWPQPTISNVNCSDNTIINTFYYSTSGSGTKDGNNQVCFKVTNPYATSNSYTYVASTTGANVSVVPNTVTLNFVQGPVNATTSTFTVDSLGPLKPDYDPNNPTNPHDVYYFTVNINDGATDDYGNPLNNPIPGKTITFTPDHDTGLTYSSYACNDGETPGVTNAQGNACFMAQANVEDTFNFNAYDATDSNVQIGSTISRQFQWPPDNTITTDSYIDLLSPTGSVYTSPKRILADHNGNIVLKVTAKNAEEQAVKVGNDVRITLNSNPYYCTFQNPNPYNESCEWFGSAGKWNGYFANYGNAHGGLTDSGNAYNPAGRSPIPTNYQASYWRVSCGDETPTPNTFGETVTNRLYTSSSDPTNILDSNVTEGTLTAYPTQIFTNGDSYTWPSNLPPQPYTDANGQLCYKFAMGGNAKVTFHAKVEQTNTYDNEGYNMTAWINTANSQTVYFYLLADNTTTISASPTSVLADGSTASTITVNLKNSSTSLSDKPVSLAGSRNNLSTIQAIQCSSNGNGETVTIGDATHTTTNQAGDACFTVVSSKIGTETFTAHDDDLNGIDANSVQVHFLDASAPPDAIIDLSGTPGDASATLNWSAPTSVYPITSYEVHYSTDNFVNDDQTCVDTSCTDTTTGANVPGLTNGVKYYFKVYSHNQNGISAASNVINLTPLAPPPAAINDLGGNAGNGNATLTWSAPNSSAPITSYIVQYSTDNFSNQNNTQTCNDPSCTDTTTGATVPSLTNGITYYFRVYAVSAGGNSAVSNIINLTPSAPLIAPNAINDLAATAQNKSATLTWTPPADNGNAITSYTIHMATDVNFSNDQVVSDTDGVATDGHAIVTGLTNGTTYYFKVMAHNLAGDGPASNVVSVIPLCNGVNDSFCLSLNIYSSILSFTDIPQSFSFQSITQSPSDQQVFSVGGSGQPDQTSLLGVYDDRNLGGFQVQVQAEGTFNNGTDSIPLSNLYIGTSTSSSNVPLNNTTAASGVVYDNSISTKGITAPANLGNGSPTSASSYSVNLGGGPVVLMNGTLNGGRQSPQGRNGHMYQFVNYYLSIPQNQKPGSYSVNLIYTLTDSTN